MRGRDLTPGEGAWIYRPESHKTAWKGKRREIPLGPKAVELVKSFLRADVDAYLFDPRDAVAEASAVRSASRKSKRTPSETKKRAEGAGVEACRPLLEILLPQRGDPGMRPGLPPSRTVEDPAG